MREFELEKVTFCIPSKGIYGRAGRRRYAVIEDDTRKIMQYYWKHYSFPEAIITKDIKDKSLQKLFKLHKTVVAIPLVQQDHEAGILFLGERKGRKYSRRNICILESVASELAILI